ncbi:adenylate/guanylate cyclase domain-containing protein [Bradyrhizobium sp. BR 1433]|uniref:adenylate/guanylate cyclase domain-containing protein n=1 Tax=Bradyrhizobium sp. BR 1433 TaxID=3447967 RepID=UPI003EE66881
MQQIAEWLEKLGLGQYALRFAENGIDLGVLPELTDEDFDRLGVLLGHRRKMLRAIADLDQAELIAAPVSPHDAERRHLTVMFCDLVGSTALSARLDPEDMWEVIRAYRAACAQVITTYDGAVARFIGDGILAYFGYPRAHEDDAERAVRAGLDVIAAIGKLETRAEGGVAVRIAIASGLVVVGDLVSGGASEEQALVGDAPNIAARLQSLAEPGVVVVAASTRRLLGNLFTLRNLGRREVKGISEPIAVWAVEGEPASESRFEAVRTARSIGFVGRKAEIEFVLSRQQLAWQGQGQAVLISGEAGIGKSRIVAMLSDSLAPGTHRRVRYQCSPYHTNSALHPFVAQLERAAGIRSEDAPEQKLDKLEAMLALGTQHVPTVTPLIAALLSIPTGDRYPPLGLSPAQQRRQTFAALLDQLEGLARQQPVLVVCEDVHWADATSLELLDLAVDRIRGLPILMLMTFRPEFEPPWAGLANVSLLRLDRLDRQDTRALIEQVTVGRLLPGEMMAQIIERTDGVPLFVEELTKMVMESGLLVEKAGRYRLDNPLPPLAIPATLQELADGTARPAGAGQGGGADRRRDRPRVLICAAAQRGRARRSDACRGACPARRGRAAAAPGRAAGRKLQLQARVGPGSGLRELAQEPPAIASQAYRRCVARQVCRDGRDRAGSRRLPFHRGRARRDRAGVVAQGRSAGAEALGLLRGDRASRQGGRHRR